MDIYKKRLADELLKEKLAGKGAVLIEGPKWCGKTTTAEQIASSILYMADPKAKKQNIMLADANPETLLKGETPRLIDEWQLAPKLWDAVRFEVDKRHDFAQFILTGSSVPADMSDVSHTGTGRFSWLKMRPMSLFESGESTGEVSLKALFENRKSVYAKNSLTLEDVAFLVCRGGWPVSTYLSGKLALNQAVDYFDSVVNSDISRVDGIKRDPEKAKRILRSFARNQGSQIGEDTILTDIVSSDDDSISRGTVRSYIEALKKIFVIEDMPAWNPNLRSKTAIRTSDTRYFVDPSIAAAALGFGPGDLMNDLKTFGLMFETMAIRDLRVYSQTLGGDVYHYRDKSGLECDAVIHLRNGRYGLVEIKLGGDKLIAEGCDSLLKLSKLIDTEKMNKPSFLMVVTANGNMAYEDENGVFVVPVGTLGA
ncbi:MAG: ATP-binding protein [Clostridia bacterium]|nr:ATP-binding protein [Clostridia bacterium]